jgi:type I restriction enzyme S subunit
MIPHGTPNLRPEQLPAGWELVRLRFLADVRFSSVDKKSEPGEQAVLLCNYMDVYRNDVIESAEGFMTATASPEEIRRFTLRAGDVLVTKDSETPDDIAVPALVRQDMPGVLCGYHLAILRPDPARCVGAYLAYALRSPVVAQQFHVAAQGVTRFGIGMDAFGDVWIPVPPLEEQDRIVRELDDRLAVLAAARLECERLLSLTEEQRHSAVVDAVARGRRQDAARRPSGLGWAGSIPASWRVARLTKFARIESGHTPSRQRPEYWENCTIPWFTLGDVWQIREARRIYIEDTAEKISELGMANSAARLLPAGTVMLSRTASVGFAGIMARPMATTQDFVNWVCGPDLLPEYLLFTFRAMRDEFRRLMAGSTHKTIYMPDLRAFQIVVPPLSEQEEIVAYLQQELKRLDGVVSELRQQLTLIEELRTSAIDAAVAGHPRRRANASHSPTPRPLPDLAVCP